ncbi:hypothetical protein ACI8AA_03690 [Geodermatophilus sp. SYSU D01180]
MTPTRALPVLLTAGALVLAGCTAVPDDPAAAAAPAALDELPGTDLGPSPDGTRGAAAGTCGDAEVVAVLVG